MSHSTPLSNKLARPGVLSWLGLVCLLSLVLAAPGSAKADSEPTGAGAEVVVSVDRPDYHYEAPKGSNLTYLSRRSLQLETESSGVITGAPLVAAETCVVQALGARDLIHVGEAIVVDGQTIDDCLEQTSQLTEAQLECWARYVPIRENLDWIEPVSVQLPGGVGAEGPQDELLPEADRADEANQTAGQAGDPADGDDGGSSFSGWYWWLIAGFIFGLGWYFMVLGRTWRSDSSLEVDDQADDKKVSQPEDDPTPVEADDSDSKEPTNKKTKPRKRRSPKGG